MNTRINSVLKGIRLHLEQEGDDAASVSVSADQGGEDAADAEPGDGGAENPPDAGDTLDLYLSNIADLLGLEYDMEDNEAENFIFSAADSFAKDGLLPDMPDDDGDPKEIAVWMGKAKSVQFAALVLKRARAMQT